jgi:hypothetical protein
LVGLTSVENLLNDLAELVDLDGKDAAVLPLEFEFGDGLAEGSINGLHSVAEDVLEAYQERKTQVASAGFADDVGEVDRSAGFPEGAGDDVAFGVDVEVMGAPTVDIVVASGRLDIPRRGLRGIVSHRTFPMGRTIETRGEISIEWIDFFQSKEVPAARQVVR